MRRSGDRSFGCGLPPIPLASSPIEQDAAYWEIKVVKAGAIRLGVARKLGPKELEGGVKPPKGGGEPGNGRAQRSWCADIALAEGDNVGVAFGQADLPNLSFTKNGKPLPEHDVKKIGGMVYPVFSVGGGACIKVLFESGDFNSIVSDCGSGSLHKAAMNVWSI